MSLRNHLKNWINQVKFMGLALVISAFAGLAVSAQHPTNCPIQISSVDGDIAVFSVTGDGTTTLSISRIDSGNGIYLRSAVVGTSPNANVVISPDPIPANYLGPVTVTASKIDPSLPASFTVVVRDTAGNTPPYSDHSITINAVANCPTQVVGCTRTQGYWKTHAENWPAGFTDFQLGNVDYTKAGWLSIFNTSVRGNGLVSLSHQLMAAKLNAAAGATVPIAVLNAMNAADALIGDKVVPSVGTGTASTSSVSSLVSILDAYNNGLAAGGPDHCDDAISSDR